MRRWIHQHRLPHLLPPEAYHSAELYQRELETVFEQGWHFVCTLDDLPQNGDFVTVDLLGSPLLVRNHGGEISAFLNVCAHRHSLLTLERKGNSPRMKCQYHGWEYDHLGAVCKIPDAACFVPVRRGSERLLGYPTSTLGKLVFVRRNANGPSLAESLGEDLSRRIERVFTAPRQAVSLEMDHPSNWKIPIENVLESYHVPLLHDNFVARHPEIFRLFRDDAKDAEISQPSHQLRSDCTIVRDAFGASSSGYRRMVEFFRPGTSLDFVHVHAFPNLLIGETGLVRYLQVVVPTGPTTSRSMMRIFLDLGQPGRGVVEKLAATFADRIAKQLFLQLMREDSPIFPAVQRGMEAGRPGGVLGSREERIHAFHRYLIDRTDFSA